MTNLLNKVFFLILPFLQLQINGEKLKVEVAVTEQERRQGLMHRESLDEGTGMLFSFDREEILTFWMKDTKIPLSIGFFDSNRRLVNIEEMPAHTKKFYHSKRPCLYALEVPAGWFEKKSIVPGMIFEWTKSN